MITRRQHLQTIRRLLKTYPVVAILGARQVGKTTLARRDAIGWDRRGRSETGLPEWLLLSGRRPIGEAAGCPERTGKNGGL